MNRRPIHILVSLLAAALVVVSGLAAAASPAPAPGAAALEARLLAPCCWVQTLDAHESEVASTLRAEIRSRLLAGESAGAIEDDLAARYGERIRAVDKGGDSRGVIPLFAAVASLLVGAGFLAWLRRRLGHAPADPAPAPVARDVYDERLDDELRALDA